MSFRGQRRPATGQPPRARPLKAPQKNGSSEFKLKRASPATAQHHPTRRPTGKGQDRKKHGVGAHPRRGSPPHPSQDKEPHLVLFSTALFSTPLFLVSSTQSRTKAGRQLAAKRSTGGNAGEREAPPPAQKRAPWQSKPGTLQEHQRLAKSRAHTYPTGKGMRRKRTSHPPRFGERERAEVEHNTT